MFNDVFFVCIVIKVLLWCAFYPLQTISCLSYSQSFVLPMFIRLENEIGSEGARHLSAALSQCATLTTLNLSSKMSSFTSDLLLSSLFCVFYVTDLLCSLAIYNQHDRVTVMSL
jgi:hypothetical protein